MNTFTRDYEFVVVNCGDTDRGGCGMEFAMPRWFYDQTKRTGESWTCPAGHSRVWTVGVEDKLRAEKTRARHLEDQLGAATREAEHLRLRILRDRQRYANGLCPCCDRSFTNVRRHMVSQHPDYDLTRIGDDDTVRFPCECGRSFDSLRGLRVHQGHLRRSDWATTQSRWARHLTSLEVPA